MSLNGWLKKLLPKQERFYLLLKEQVRVLKRMTHYLQSFTDTALSDGDEFYIHCHEIEQQGDDLLREMAIALAKTFVTPLDREDLYQLSVLIENSLDACDEAVRGFKLLPGKQAYTHVMFFANLLDEAAQHLVTAIDALPSREFSLILASDGYIKALEKKADAYYREQMTYLFQEVDDIKSLLILKEVFEKLEDATDEMAHLSTFLTNLAVKHG